MSRVFHGRLAVFFWDKLRRFGVFFFFGGGLGMSCFFFPGILREHQK